MNNEPVSISTLISAVRAATVAKAPLQADRPIAIGEDFAALAPEARTAQSPRQPPRKPAASSSSASFGPWGASRDRPHDAPRTVPGQWKRKSSAPRLANV